MFERIKSWLKIAPPETQPPQMYMTSLDGFAGRESQAWSPNGFVSLDDEIAQNRYMVSGPFAYATKYAYSFPFNGRQDGDEYALKSYEWGWIPTEQQLGAAVALQNMGVMINQHDTTLQQVDPMQNQLLQAIYRSANAFWQETRNTNGTSWGY